MSERMTHRCPASSQRPDHRQLRRPPRGKESADQPHHHREDGVDMGTEKYATPLSLASGFAAGLMFAGWRLQQRRVRRHVG
jgi:hypothetical protein